MPLRPRGGQGNEAVERVNAINHGSAGLSHLTIAGAGASSVQIDANAPVSMSDAELCAYYTALKMSSSMVLVTK